MKQSRRFLIALALLVIISALVLGVDMWQRQQVSQPAGAATPLPPGSIPISLDGSLVGGFAPADLEKLQAVSFTDAEDGKLQDGWLLRDVILLYIPAEQLEAGARVAVISSSRGKSAQLTWANVENQANRVMFDLSNRGTLKLVSLLPELDQREEWIQDVDKIEITQP